MKSFIKTLSRINKVLEELGSAAACAIRNQDNNNVTNK